MFETPMNQFDDTLTVQDHFEIQRLMTEYAFCDDNGNAERWASLFTEDGTFVGLNKAPITGRDKLIAFAKKRWAEQPNVRKRAHWVGNIAIWPTSEGAEAKCYQMTVDRMADGMHIHKLTGKLDELRRVAGKWRFHIRRTVEVTAE